MNEILQIVDKHNSAIGELAHMVNEGDWSLQTDILPLHPKRPDDETITWLRENWHDYDLIHWQYWKSWEKARELIPDIDNTPSVITLHNPYDLDKYKWISHHDEVCVMNEAQHEKVGYATVIRHAVREANYTFNDNKRTPCVGMCAARIEGSKGILEVAQVCAELDIPLLLMGRISDREYFDKVKQTCEVKRYLEWPEDKKTDVYSDMAVYVVNSKDNFESGPMPPFEAILSGTPVVSRKIGAVAEVLSEERGEVKFFDGKEQMKKAITDTIEKDGQAMAEAAWKQAKNLTRTRWARNYWQVYNRAAYKGHPCVSVIIPYKQGELSEDDRTEITQSILQQTYKNTEIIFQQDTTPKGVYGLPKTRNEGITRSHGKYILFLDSRLALDSDDTIQKFIHAYSGETPVMVWGDKGAGEREFVENFSFVQRKHIIEAGMFNETVRWYGGTTQELRRRLARQGFVFLYCKGARAREIRSSQNKRKRKSDIMQAKDHLFKLGL